MSTKQEVLVSWDKDKKWEEMYACFGKCEL